MKNPTAGDQNIGQSREYAHETTNMQVEAGRALTQQNSNDIYAQMSGRNDQASVKAILDGSNPFTIVDESNGSDGGSLKMDRTSTKTLDHWNNPDVSAFGVDRMQIDSTTNSETFQMPGSPASFDGSSVQTAFDASPTPGQNNEDPGYLRQLQN